jgi:hypothetical protein
VWTSLSKRSKREIFQCDTIWDGVVHMFKLTGQPKATMGLCAVLGAESEAKRPAIPAQSGH